ncbi:helix-turn-helix domain-containing protein [Roseibium limicola]|uniref:Helix-turn-helix transcriptional regulator n=1 Tax=Roseibium limicola TaxID=2816037 RepID=A0A939END1_9HYPH|nr:AraC family transcriptional regulator [Roseibium limicola]MBO0345597.1 helix-turn-helix transcriptional regulator [Roseibium limicola]
MSAHPVHAGQKRKLVEVDCRSWEATSISTVKCSRVQTKFQTFIFMEGEQSFWLDGAFFHISAGHGAQTKPKALTFVLNQETDIRLLRGTNRPLRKISLTSPISWMDDMHIDPSACHKELTRFLSGHLNYLIWEPGPDVLSLCKQIQSPPTWLEGEMRELYLSARGLEVMMAVCQRISGSGDEQAEPVFASKNQMNKVRDYLLAHLDDDLNIGTVARETGTSVRSLQRKFREHFGEPVFEYVRQARLFKAREALLREGVSVSEAATLAGYNRIGSFSAAFKRQFGECPSTSRLKT